MSTINLKSLLKTIKLNESTISMVLGGLVIVIVGVLVTNYFNDRKTQTDITETASSTESVVTKHTVAEGEDLWKIAEKYYNDGYEWSAIAKENKIDDPNSIEVGQELVIPEVSQASETTAVVTTTATVSPAPTEAVIADADEKDNDSKGTDTKVTAGSTYTVKRGDSLWTIAEEAYGDGYRWSDISEANELANPDVIHSGNVLKLPQ